MGCQASTPLHDSLDDSLHSKLRKSSNAQVDDVYTREKQIASTSAGSLIIHVKKTKFVKTQHSGYAMKLYDGTSALPPDLKTEAEILQMCDHPHIVKLYEVAKHKKNDSLVMELCKGGTLEKCFPYSENEVTKILWQILSAVDYLHKKGIVHRDINLSNIMFEDENENVESSNHKDDKVVRSNVKLIDFGCATRLQYWTDGAFKGTVKFLTEQTGGIYTMAPEVINCKYTTQADMWSVGVCAYMLMTDGIKPFDGDNIQKIQTKIKCNAVDYTKIKSKKATTFIKKCLNTNPSIRLTAGVALRDPWIMQTREKVIMPNKLVVAFQEYMQASVIKRIAYNMLAHHADPKAISEYRNLFRNLDSTQTNTLTRTDFVTGFEATGFSSEELERLFTALDINDNDEILYTEFLAGTMANDVVNDSQIKFVFDEMDANQSGYITKKNIITLLGKTSFKKTEFIVSLKDFHKLSFSDFRDLFAANTAENYFNRSLETFIEEEDEESEEYEDEDEAKIDSYAIQSAAIEQKI